MAEKTVITSSKSLRVLKIIFRWEIIFLGPAYFWDFVQRSVNTPAPHFLLPLLAEFLSLLSSLVLKTYQAGC